MSTTQQGSHVDRTDDELAAPLRGGEAAEEELAELYRRHHTAVRAYAVSRCRDAHTADDAASEAFARTIEAVRRGGGPRGPWRPYLLTAVRRIVIDWAVMNGRALPSDELQDEVDEALTGEEMVLSREEGALVVRSFQQLPERWQTVLWYTTVQKEPTAKVAERLGISESGVTSLAERAREGLREAYLSVHAHAGDQDEDSVCGRYSGLLAAAVRRRRRPGRDLKRHLGDCADCRQAFVDLTDLNARLRVVLPGAILFGVGAELASAAGTAKASAAALSASGAAVSDPTVLASSWHALPFAKSAASVGAGVAVVTACYFALQPYESTITPPPPSPSASATTTPSSPPSEVTRPDIPYGPTAVLRSAAGGDCLEPVPGPANKVRTADCDGSTNQTWVEDHVRGARLLLHNSGTGLCLRDLEAGTAAVAQARCDAGDPRQVWVIRYSREHRSMVAIGRDGETYLV
ncbi:sigma-70 family RNA polymerase sigma factor [Streptomyces sp. NPDC057099]|uniref:sigma-70 family RNA polymerase sigma factor n=1 Tax=Streptomyces sp. NPDC057099 TaxID=3346019 RepID=UPI003642C396